MNTESLPRKRSECCGYRHGFLNTGMNIICVHLCESVVQNSYPYFFKKEPQMNTDKHRFLFKEETHKIVGCAMEVLNTLGVCPRIGIMVRGRWFESGFFII